MSCIPGDSKGCVGMNGCTGYQACKANGTGYEPCHCGTSTATSGSGGSSSSSQASAQSSGPGSTSSVTTTTTSASTTGSTGAGGGGQNWTPKSLAGLSLWLDGDLGIIFNPQKPGIVSKWLDQSGNNNNGVAGGNTSINPAAINGHQTLTCPPLQTPLSLGHNASLEWSPNSFIIGVVFRADIKPADNFPIELMQRNPQDIINKKQFDVYVGVGYNLVIQLDADKLALPFQGQTWSSDFHVAVARGPKLKLALDGSVATSAATTDLAFGTQDLVLCGAYASNKVEYAEIVMAKGTITDTDETKLTAYFKTKYGL